MKKAVSILLAGLMLLSLSACSNTKTSSTASKSSASSQAGSTSGASSEGKTSITYPLTGGKKLSLAWQELPAITVTCKWADTPFIKELEKNTGISLDIQHPADFSTLFASGTYPDMMYYNWNTYTGGASKAIADGVIIGIEDQLQTNAPDYQNMLASNESWQKQCTTPDKHIYGFNFIRTTRLLQTSWGMIIRKDWLKDLNMEIPQTPDEMYNVLVAFRDKKGSTVPLSINAWNAIRFVEWGAVTSPFGLVRGGYYQQDSKVHYGYTEDAYKNVLTWLHKLYSEKLLDNNFATLDGAVANANIMNGVSGFSSGAIGGALGNWLSTVRATGNTTFDLAGVGSLVAKKGDTAMSGHYDNAVPGGTVAISSSCKDVETACKFLNYGYTEKGNTLFNYGIENTSFTMKNGVETYTDLITKNPNGLTMQQALAQYCLAWDGGPFGQQEGYIKQYFAKEEQQQALSEWTNNKAADYAIPSVSVPAADLDEYSSIFSEVNTCVSENFTKFITGERSLDEFGKYQQELKNMGVERMIEIYQKALDEFNAR